MASMVIEVHISPLLEVAIIFRTSDLSNNKNLNFLSYGQLLFLFYLSTFDKNIITTIKMRNNFCYPFKMVIFWYPNIGLFSMAPHLVIALPTLRQQKLSLLIFLLKFLYEFWFMVSFLYCFPYSYRFFNYCDSNSCRSLTL